MISNWMALMTEDEIFDKMLAELMEDAEEIVSHPRPVVGEFIEKTPDVPLETPMVDIFTWMAHRTFAQARAHSEEARRLLRLGGIYLHQAKQWTPPVN